MPALPLSPQVFAILSTLVEERTGLHYGPNEAELFAERVSQRAVDAGFTSLLDYYYLLRYDEQASAEWLALVDALVVNETYFFRESDQLRVLVNDLLGPALAAGERARIWCAACSTGEEPLTIAMLLDERGWLGNVEIVASDISSRALARARAGQFSRRAMRALPPGAERWLEVHDDAVAVRKDIRDAVQWRQVNLVERPEVAPLGLFEAVVCRNVLIYFRDDTTRAVAGTLASALRPGGHLLVGASESLLRFGTSLDCRERGGAFFYTKVA